MSAAIQTATAPMPHAAEPATLDRILDQVVALTQHQQRPSPVHLRSWEEIERFAEKAARSGMVPKDYVGKPDAIVIAVQMGSELGLAPMQSLQNIAVINGRPSIWGDAMPALIRASGKCEYIREWSDGAGDTLTYHCEAKRRDDPTPATARFGVTEAKRAGLWGKDLYAKYPQRMLLARARGFALRDAFPDVLKGLIAAEEAMAMEPLAPTPTLDRRVNTAPHPGPTREATAQNTYVEPPEPAKPAKPTVTQWLNALALELAACEGADEVDAILARSEVQLAQDKFRNGAADRLRDMIQVAIERTGPDETSAPNDGVYANPADDPFRELAPS